MPYSYKYSLRVLLQLFAMFIASLRYSLTSSVRASIRPLASSRPPPTPFLSYTYSTTSTNQPTMSTPNSLSALMEAVTKRRSTYTLSTESTISDAEIKQILETTLEQAPSTFGSYTTRIVLVVKEEHTRLWDIIFEVVKGVTPPEQFNGYTKKRLEGFRNVYGTVLL